MLRAHTRNGSFNVQIRGLLRSCGAYSRRLLSILSRRSELFRVRNRSKLLRLRSRKELLGVRSRLLRVSRINNLQTPSASFLHLIPRSTLTSTLYVASDPFLSFQVHRKPYLLLSSVVKLRSMSYTTVVSVFKYAGRSLHLVHREQEMSFKCLSLIWTLQFPSPSP